MPRNAIPRGEIFVLDDDAATRETLSSAFEMSGYRSVCFADSAALLSELRLRTPLCIFLEIRLPERAGLDLLRKLHAQNFPAPIFAASANADIATAVEALRCGAVDFIEKPACGGDVVERIEAAIEEFTQPDDDGLPRIAMQLPGCEPFTRREREVLARLAAGESPATEAALVKDLGTEFEQLVPIAIADLLGASDAPVPSELQRTLAYITHFAPTFSLRGGTREVLRGMIARGLGLR